MQELYKQEKYTKKTLEAHLAMKAGVRLGGREVCGCVFCRPPLDILLLSLRMSFSKKLVKLTLGLSSLLS